MFKNIVSFFIEHTRLNYLLFAFVFSVGIYTYLKTPKEIFPLFDLEQIIVTGSYSGASLDNMDKMAVNPLEDELKNIDEVDTMTTVITSGKFTTVLELKQGTNPYNILDKVKDGVSISAKTRPSDMDEPVVRVLTIQKELLNIVLLSKKYSIDELKPYAENLKDIVSTVKGISEVSVYGDSDIIYNILVNPKKVEAFGLDFKSVIGAISTISYIFPIGVVEDKKNGFAFISTKNKNIEELKNSKISIDGKTIYLKDIAKIKREYEESATRFAIDTKDALSILVKQSATGDALEIKRGIEKKLKEFKELNPKIETFIYNDNSEKILDRLNIVISNILFGLIIIFFLVTYLINIRMAIIIAIGIPTSFVMGAFYFYMYGYTINMISLIGVLIALGIIVDDAIVVSENIQQYLEKGYPIKEATIKGTVEMAKPVTLASLTTIFAFLPALMISGTMGEVIKLIPIAVSALLLASLIESFIFLPIHASHTLKSDAKARSWAGIQRFYSLIIHKAMNSKKLFLFLFIIIIPLLTVIGIKISKFQMFPSFDATTINISLKASPNNDVEDINRVLKEIQKEIYSKKEEFFIKHIGAVAGYRRDSAFNVESYPYVGDITIILEKPKASNFLDKYVTPYLSFYYDKENRIRENSSQEISKKLQQFLKEKNYEKRFNLKEILVVQRRVGPVKSDIAIGLSSNNNLKMLEALDTLKSKIKSINGVTTITTNVNYGREEIELKINSYGEYLGLDNASIGTLLSNFYLSRMVTNSFDTKEGVVEIKVESSKKDDLEELKGFEITLKDGRVVLLDEVVKFNRIKSLEQLTKDNAEKLIYIFSSLDRDKITATEVLSLLEEDIKNIEKDGVKVLLKGEEEKKRDLKNDLLWASILAISLILLTLVYLFNSFRDSFMLLTVIPFSVLGAIIGHLLLGINLTMPSFIGILGLTGVVINDGIIMMITLKKGKTLEDFYKNASSRFRPIVLTSVTTLIGLSTIIFFPTGQAVIFQPLAISLGFGLAWGTILNLLYLPVLYALIHQKEIKTK